MIAVFGIAFVGGLAQANQNYECEAYVIPCMVCCHANVEGNLAFPRMQQYFLPPFSLLFWRFGSNRMCMNTRKTQQHWLANYIIWGQGQNQSLI